MAPYPDTDKYLTYLKNNIRAVIYVDDLMPEMTPVMRNLVVLAKASMHPDFPVKPEYIEQSILGNSKGNPEQSLKIYRESIKL
jgi:hypothetical protein